ncbi:MAG TPA: hypothetical protein H9662_06650 [Firmicutes bacterium]|nr:hypothetical protein [Bacillota bacterium]
MKKLRKLNSNTNNTLHMSALCGCTNPASCNCGITPMDGYAGDFNDSASVRTQVNQGK